MNNETNHVWLEEMIVSIKKIDWGVCAQVHDDCCDELDVESNSQLRRSISNYYYPSIVVVVYLSLSLSSQSEVIIEIICLVRSLYVMDFFFHRLNFVDFSSPLMRDRSENTVFLHSLFLCSFHNSLWKIVISSDMYQNLLHWTAISNSHTNHTKNCGRDREKDKLRRWKCEDGYEEDKKKIKRKTEVRIGWLLI